MNYSVAGDMHVEVPKMNSLRNKTLDFVIMNEDVVCDVRFHWKISRKKKRYVWYCIHIL